MCGCRCNRESHARQEEFEHCSYCGVDICLHCLANHRPVAMPRSYRAHRALTRGRRHPPAQTQAVVAVAVGDPATAAQSEQSGEAVVDRATHGARPHPGPCTQPAAECMDAPCVTLTGFVDPSDPSDPSAP